MSEHTMESKSEGCSREVLEYVKFFYARSIFRVIQPQKQTFAAIVLLQIPTGRFKESLISSREERRCIPVEYDLFGRTTKNKNIPKKMLPFVAPLKNQGQVLVIDNFFMTFVKTEDEEEFLKNGIENEECFLIELTSELCFKNATRSQVVKDHVDWFHYFDEFAFGEPI